MKTKIYYIKDGVVIIGAWIGDQLGILFPASNLLIAVMIGDYISGLLAARKEALENPKDKDAGLSSRKSLLGIYKKMGYIITVFVAVGIDYLLKRIVSEFGITVEANTMFGLLVSIWFIINEMISILENVGKIGVELPNILMKILCELKTDIDNESKGQEK